MNELNQKIRALHNDLVKYYEISIDNVNPITNKTYKITDSSGKNYFLKETNYNALEKYQFLADQGINNVLYPRLNEHKEYVTRNLSHAFYINDYYEDSTIYREVKAQNLFSELNSLHQQTSFVRQLNASTSRPKFEEITNRLDYKYKMLENYVRSIEAKPLNIYSMPILANYQYYLDAKKELVRLQKRIISSIKAKDSIEYSFLHNNPQLNHLLNIRGAHYLVSLDSGKIGINSLDMAKYYIENEDLNLDFKTLIGSRYASEHPFYYDYFRYMILLIYVSRTTIGNDEYANAQTFINTSNSIKKYFNQFSDFEEVTSE